MLFIGGLITTSWHGLLGIVLGIALMVVGAAIIVRFWGKPEDEDFP